MAVTATDDTNKNANTTWEDYIPRARATSVGSTIGVIYICISIYNDRYTHMVDNKLDADHLEVRHWSGPKSPFWSAITEYLLGVRICVLDNEGVTKAQNVLGTVYGEEMGWKPDGNNPALVRFIDGRIRDNFESSCVWLGAFTNNELVGTIRVICSEGGSGLEISRYYDMPETRVDGAVEVNRMAILKPHRGSCVGSLLLIAVVWVSGHPALIPSSDKFFRQVYVAPSQAKAVKAAQKLGFKYRACFKYEPEDPTAVPILSRVCWRFPFCDCIAVVLLVVRMVTG